MPLPVGIDLGTTNSVISVYKRGRSEALAVEGAVSMPSAVCFRDTHTVLVGAKALGMAMVRPECTVLSVKRKMGDRSVRYDIYGKSHTPVDISALILRKLCEGHEQELGGPLRDAVIAVPAYFTDSQRKDTKLAGEKAGLNVLRLLPEPTAAAIAIGLDKGRDQTILVYDLGGGTFDVSILRVEGNSFSVQAVNGIHDLGGNDFDTALRRHVLEEFAKRVGVDLAREGSDSPDVRRAMQSLSVACERAKMELSDADEAFLDLPNLYGGAHFDLTIARDTFESLIRGLILRTKDLVLKTIRDVKLNVDDIDRLVLVGGSTKVPLVSRVLAEAVKEPYVADNVDLAVSAGAAIMAANLHAVEEVGASPPDYAPVEISVTDVVPHPISLEFVAGCSVVLEKNAPLPARAMLVSQSLPGSTSALVPIFRGDGLLPSQNEFLGELVTTLKPSREFTFFLDVLELDENGVLQFEALIIDAKESEVLELDRKAKKGILDPATLRVKEKARVEIKLPD